MHLLQKEFMEKHLCWYAHGELYVPRDTMVERMVVSTSSSSNVHGVVYNNSNHYRNMIMDAMRMNQGHAGQCSIIDENLMETRPNLLIFCKILTNYYRMVAQITVNYRSLHLCSTSSQIMG